MSDYSVVPPVNRFTAPPRAARQCGRAPRDWMIRAGLARYLPAKPFTREPRPVAIMCEPHPDHLMVGARIVQTSWWCCASARFLRAQSIKIVVNGPVDRDDGDCRRSQRNRHCDDPPHDVASQCRLHS
jgi:hypothetical protein